MELPRKTREIFERLSRGNFICQNSPSPEERRLFEICEENDERLSEYFSPIGFELDSGPGYFYFSRVLSETQIETRLDNILHLLDHIEMFLQHDEYFAVGWRGTPTALAEAATDNIVIKERIERIRGVAGENLVRKCENIFKKMERDGYMALEDEYENRYVVLTSYAYLVDFFKGVEEVDHDEPA